MIFKIKRFPQQGYGNRRDSDTKVQMMVRILTGESQMSEFSGCVYGEGGGGGGFTLIGA